MYHISRSTQTLFLTIVYVEISALLKTCESKTGLLIWDGRSIVFSIKI